jgi:hypothetical protein
MTTMRADLVERLEKGAGVFDAAYPDIAGTLREAAAALRALRDAPVVTVHETSTTFGHGDFGRQWTIGNDYMGRPEWAGRLKGQRVRLVPLDTTAGVG